MPSRDCYTYIFIYLYNFRLVLEKDFKAADLRWSLFVAAALCFRYDVCLKPYPPGFLKNNIKDMDELVLNMYIYFINSN